MATTSLLGAGIPDVARASHRTVAAYGGGGALAIPTNVAPLGDCDPFAVSVTSSGRDPSSSAVIPTMILVLLVGRRVAVMGRSYRRAVDIG